ncbi:unnamed protein product [Orchesella dallaii]|uniref:2'-5'-oligoadenylate synthetase 1 domain-containing protein n=1 Tax=Orchesella dallaii TaxID=48710 RepID=A0ABP1S663_9HEXA
MDFSSIIIMFSKLFTMILRVAKLLLLLISLLISKLRSEIRILGRRIKYIFVDSRNDIDYRLKRFGERLKRPEQYYLDGSKLVTNLFDIIQQRSRHEVIKYRIGGSFGKKTDVIEPDLDLVILVNNFHPHSLQGSLDEFERILRQNEGRLQIRLGRYSKTNRSLNFSFTNGISVDLLPAADLSVNKKQDVLELLENDHENLLHFYNPSFVEDQIKFMKAQDSFAHTLARLSKFWLKSLDLGESFRGGSAMMELIAVAAVINENMNEERSISRGFTRVLSMVINLKTTKIAFINLQNNRNWQRVAPACLHSDNNSLIPNIIGKIETLERGYFIVDPANPFQDFLEGKSDRVLRKLKEFACSTQSRLDKILKGSGQRDQDEFIQELFEPMFEHFPSDHTVASVSLPTNVLVSYDVPCTSVYNKEEIFNRNISANPKTKRAVTNLKKDLLAAIHSTVKGKNDASVSDVKNEVLNLLRTALQIRTEEASDFQSHNRECDAMIRIPYLIVDKGYAVYLSMSWIPESSDLDIWKLATDTYCDLKHRWAELKRSMSSKIKSSLVLVPCLVCCYLLYM